MHNSLKWEKGSSPVTVIVLTLNEAHNLDGLLNNLKGWASNVYIVDSYSKDKTIDIALSYGVEISQKQFIDFGSQWNFAINTLPIKSDWCLKLDPDERLTEELKREITQKCANTTKNGFYAKIQLFFMGKKLPVQLNLLRLWRTGHAQMSEVRVNEHLIVSGLTDSLKNIIEHHDSPDLDHWLEKQNRYTSAEAVSRFNYEKLSFTPNLFGNKIERRMWFKKNFYKIPFRYSILFCYYFFFLGSWKTGRVGYIWARLRTDVMRLIEYKYIEIKLIGRFPIKKYYGSGDKDSRVSQF